MYALPSGILTVSAELNLVESILYQECMVGELVGESWTTVGGNVECRGWPTTPYQVHNSDPTDASVTRIAANLDDLASDACIALFIKNSKAEFKSKSKSKSFHPAQQHPTPTPYHPDGRLKLCRRKLLLHV